MISLELCHRSVYSFVQHGIDLEYILDYQWPINLCVVLENLKLKQEIVKCYLC